MKITRVVWALDLGSPLYLPEPRRSPQLAAPPPARPPPLGVSSPPRSRDRSSPIRRRIGPWRISCSPWCEAYVSVTSSEDFPDSFGRVILRSSAPCRGCPT